MKWEKQQVFSSCAAFHNVVPSAGIFHYFFWFFWFSLAGSVFTTATFTQAEWKVRLRRSQHSWTDAKGRFYFRDMIIACCYYCASRRHIRYGVLCSGALPLPARVPPSRLIIIKYSSRLFSYMNRMRSTFCSLSPSESVTFLCFALSMSRCRTEFYSYRYSTWKWRHNSGENGAIYATRLNWHGEWRVYWKYTNYYSPATGSINWRWDGFDCAVKTE